MWGEGVAGGTLQRGTTGNVSALDRIDRLYSDKYSSGMMDAILIGETARLDRIWTDDFRRTGTFHALVISGVHVTVLAAVLLFLLHWLPISELSALAMTAASAWLYALVSGLSAPVVRAAGGFTLSHIAQSLRASSSHIPPDLNSNPCALWNRHPRRGLSPSQAAVDPRPSL